MPRKGSKKFSIKNSNSKKRINKLKLSKKEKSKRNKNLLISQSKSKFCHRKNKQKVKKRLSKYIHLSPKKTNVCEIITPRGNIINLPNEYPGDDFVFSELYTNPDDKFHAEMIEPSILRDTYNKYNKMCF